MHPVILMPLSYTFIGDEVAVAIAPAVATEDQTQKDQLPQSTDESTEEKDPFAASEKLNKPEEALVGGFKKIKDPTADPTASLVGLEVTALPPAEATKPTFVSVEGFEGDYGGIEFGREEIGRASGRERVLAIV